MTMKEGDQSERMSPPVVWPDPRIVEDFPYDFDLTTHTVYAASWEASRTAPMSLRKIQTASMTSTSCPSSSRLLSGCSA